ncbi:M20/M25/M40 family metallo-hydrolase [Corynebacterium pseudopelargi]|uniref:Succinyl-diaminopimelate desuccinylase n=1 Tax=Corynebacterium pseudopelargi TaxID=2080757 RepID=A0A3G6IRI7_9CORY|nr:M20/M25/M40 family metallo-hydrolase [Corynebacterium pseudopelargi]AZA08195.1 Succinyl-diaminopimelate desuccinylase [Corynebacterium pseudopelargi]
MHHELFDDTLALLQDLIRNACVNDLTAPSGQEVRNADTLEAFFAGSGAQVQRFESAPGRVSIAFSVPGTDPDAKPLTLLGHTDVVPVDRGRWSVDPFAAEIREGKIYGRGAVDMLFITAIMAAVTRKAARAGGLGGTLTFVGVADEEARGGLGAAWLQEHHPEAFSWQHCLSETGGAHLPTADGSDALTVYVGEKGAAQRRIHVYGDAGHGSAPYHKDSSIVKIGQVAARIAAIAPQVSTDPTWQGFVKAFRFDAATEAAVLRGERYEALGQLAAYGDAISHLSIAQTVLRAGQAINVLPSHAWLELDIRTLPGQSDEDVDALLHEALEGIDVEIEHLISEEATISPTDHPLYEVLEAVLVELFPGAQVVPTIAAGGSDLRFARRAGGVGYGFAAHAIERTLGAVHAQLHSHDEYLHLEDLDLSLRAYDAVVQRFCGPAV